MASDKLRFYFSFRSPFAGIAFYQLRRLAVFDNVDIELLPLWPEVVFGGHMDNPTDNIFKMAYIFHDAARQAKLAGIDEGYFQQLAKQFVLPEQADYKSEKVGLAMAQEHWQGVHHAFLYAQQQGLGWSFGDAIFARRFNFDGGGAADVMDLAVTARVAEQLGLDGAAAAQSAASGVFVDRQHQVIRQSERDGVFGVPFFVLEQAGGKQCFWGNDRLPFLMQQLNGLEELPVIRQSDLTAVRALRT